MPIVAYLIECHDCLFNGVTIKKKVNEGSRHGEACSSKDRLLPHTIKHVSSAEMNFSFCAISLGHVLGINILLKKKYAVGYHLN